VRRGIVLAAAFAGCVVAAAPLVASGSGLEGTRAAATTCLGARATIVGTPRADILRGTARRDVIAGRGGADRLLGLGGDDLLCGGAGNDRIDGGGGRDRVDGGLGANTCVRAERRAACGPAEVNVLTLTLDRPLAPGFVDRTRFRVEVFGRTRAITEARPAGRTVVLTTDLPSELLSDDPLSVSYHPRAGRLPLRAAGGAPVAPFAATLARSGATTGCAYMPGTPTADPSEGPTDTNRFLSPLRTIGLAVIWVRFTDLGHGPRTNASPITSDVYAWLSGVSDGRAAIAGQGPDEIFSLGKPTAAYGTGGVAGITNVRQLAADAVAAADAQIDFGRVQQVVIVPPRATTTRTAILTDPIRADGNAIRHVVFSSSTRLDTFALALPFLTLAGLPDLHDQIGRWDAMSATGTTAPMGLIAWHRRKLGWLDATAVRCPQPGTPLELTLAPLAGGIGTRAIVIPDPPDRAYVLENRARVGVDGYVCEPGILVYQIATLPGSAPLTLRPARPSIDESKRGPCGNLYAATFTGGRIVLSAFEADLLALGPDGSYRIRVTSR
jgi:RTX calcium-binding nonapeptide repeat (4 copies)